MATKKGKPRIPSGDEIKARMKEKKLKQGELAVLVGVSDSMISGLISGKRDTCSRHMKKIIEVLWWTE